MACTCRVPLCPLASIGWGLCPVCDLHHAEDRPCSKPQTFTANNTNKLTPPPQPQPTPTGKPLRESRVELPVTEVSNEVPRYH